MGPRVGLDNIVKILDVEYRHIKLRDGDDLYITGYGLPFVENLKPENFLTDEGWFKKNSVRLSGTSRVYKVRTKEIGNKSMDIVIKWNRMGQDVPRAGTTEELINAEFNSPFEEFSLVTELRKEMAGSGGDVIIQKPLAVYTPKETLELWQTGRKEYTMQYKIQAHRGIVLDMRRAYVVIYEWIEGIDAEEACREGIFGEKDMELITAEVEDKIRERGFIVMDRKPHHVIVRPKKNGELVRDSEGDALCGLVDFELLQRTPVHEDVTKKAKRAVYLRRQRDRFSGRHKKKGYPYLKSVKIMDVDYVYGHVESTGGRLWVVGKDPELFDYFLPEKWLDTPKTKISLYSSTYYTVTKDNIHLVWKISMVGMKPDMDPFKEDEREILEYGYNSPFEEVSIAVELGRKGIGTIYPRAIYMTSNKTDISDNIFDNSRYKNHKRYVTPDGTPALEKNRDYIIIWGYWNGPDEKLAAKDGDYYEGVNALRAYKEGIITQGKYIGILNISRKKLQKAGIKDLNLRGNHLLISLDNAGKLVKDKYGEPEIRICNFAFLKRIKEK